MKSSRVGFSAVFLLILASMISAEEPAVRIDEIQQAIRDAEYHVTWQDQTVLPDLDAAWHATNRAQNLRFYFTEDGLRVVDRTDVGSPELLRLAVSDFSGNDANQTFLEATGNQLKISRSWIHQSFVNDHAGLHHILAINDPPPGDGPLVMELEWLAAGISVSDHAAEFRSAAGRRLVYSIEDGIDGSGAPMGLQLSASGNRLRLAVLGSNPVYPIIIKSLLSGAADTVLERNVAFDRLGTSAATGDLNGDGFADVAVASTAWNDGHVYEGAILVFYGRPGGIPGNGTGSIADAADVVIQSDVAGLLWPDSLAIVGDVNGDGFDDLVAGGVYWQPTPALPNEKWGAVWIFEGSASGITATTSTDADTFITSNVNEAMFGAMVDAAGDVNGDGFADVIAVAPNWDDDPTQVSEGATFVFHGSAAGITASSITQADAVIEGNEILVSGASWVAGLGDVDGDGYDDVAVGIFSLDHPESGEGGIAIIYGGAGGIGSNPTQPLADAADTLIEGNLANLALVHVSGAGDVNGDGFDDVIIGGPYWEDSPANSNEGVVTVFHGRASRIPSNGTTALVDAADSVIEGNPTPHVTLEFGRGISGAGDFNGDGFADVVASAPEFTNGEAAEGALFVFFGGATGIASSRTDPVEDVADVVIEGNMTSLYLGWIGPETGDVNGDGYSDMVVPAQYYSSSETQEGAVFVYHGGAEDLDSESYDYFDGHVASDWFGSNVAAAGDLNGDGFADFVIGLPLYDSGSSGRVHVFLGSSAPSLTLPDWTYDGDGQTGQGVGSAGDVNGDGYGDLVVGRWTLGNPELNEGRVEVFYGSDTGLQADPDWTYESDIADANLGYSVSSAGDINGDGYGDLVVGAPFYSNGELEEGRAYVFFGSAQGLPSQPGWTFENDVADSLLGTSVASAGDVNGDGFGDVVIGAPDFESGHSKEGAAYGFWGSATGLPDVPNWIIETDRTNAEYGWELSGVGDVNGDGFDDVVVGAPFDSNGEAGEGRAYVYHGSVGGLSTAANRVLEQNIATAIFGWSVSGAGDVNADGYADLVVGSPSADGLATDVGRAYLYTGSVSGGGVIPAWSVEGAAANDWLGGSVAGIGDFDGDGYSDVVVGVPFSDVGGTDGGSFELYLGNAGPGRPVQARQSRGGGDPTPVQPWGLTHSGDDFQVSVTATSPRGRELAKLHVEACPQGETWGDVDCRHAVSHAWTQIPLGEAGVVLTETVSSLTEDVVYHWRAHVLYLPLNADQSGITEPPVPRHGPWRTLSARAAAADIRVGEPQSITIEMVNATTSVSESTAQAGVDVVVTTSDGAVTEVDASVDYLTYDGTAVAGQDYVHTSWHLLYPAGTASGAEQSILVDLTGDDLDEPDEDFSVEISNPTGAVLGAQTANTVTILDDDPPPDLSAVDIQVDEGAGLATVTLELSEPTSYEVSVGYATLDGTAVAPEDYESVSGTATIPPMDTTATVEIPISDDGLDEINETFTLELSGASNASLTMPSVVVIILDDDPPPDLSAVDIQIDEGAGLATVTLELSAPTSYEVSVGYATLDGTAVAPEDYGSVSGTATIPPMDTTTTVGIPIADDGLDEINETFTLELSGASNASLTTPSVVVTILDNDAPPELSAADVQVDEADGMVTVMLELSAASSFEVTVDFATVEDTATSPEDFGHVSDTAVIPPMDTTTTVEIPIEDDWAEELPESFMLDLTGATNAALVTPSVTITIYDDDAGLLFVDGFESGDTSVWGNEVP